MRTLTQVWFFLVTLTFIFLLCSFQLLGRAGLFVAFLISLMFLYAALQNSMRLFKGNLKVQHFSGNDPTGFLSEIEKNKNKFGFQKVEVYLTRHHTPPLVWKNAEDTGYVIINDQLLPHLKPSEVKLLAIFVLSHLEVRSFVLVHILSILKIPLFAVSLPSRVFSAFILSLFKKQNDLFNSDFKFISASETNQYEAGYFINKLHHYSFNQFAKPNAFCFFSALSLPKKSLINEFGLPNLDIRLKKVMGFSV